MEQKVALAILLITSIILGSVGGLTSAFLASQPGPQGEQGPPGQDGLDGQDGSQGPIGPAGPQGEQGLAGSQGEQGPQGPAGPSGTDGAAWLSGSGAPDSSLGSDGDYYLDFANNDIYKKASGAWLKETNIAAGANGATWLSGSGAPTSDLGSDGDYYLDTNNSEVYNKVSGAWTVIASIKGEKGDTGDQGPQGEQGIQGIQGEKGDTGDQGPQGETGATGPIGATGPEGPQGEQGLPGADGSNSVIQVIYSRNSTILETQSYPTMQWVNMSELDSSMMININVQQNSRLLIQFSASISIVAPASLQTRVVVDNNYISTVSTNSASSASTGTIIFSDHIEFVTNPLNIGTHTINLQVLRENGLPTILDRTITIMEITSP
jgi:hypothetical protein